MVIRTIDKISYSIFFPSQWQFASKSLLYMHIISLATMRLLVNVAFLSLFLYLLFALSYINFSVVSSQSSYVFFFLFSLFSWVHFDRYSHSIFKRHPLVIIITGAAVVLLVRSFFSPVVCL